MIKTHRCRQCGDVLEAFVEVAPGLPLVAWQSTVDSQVRTAEIRHAERCRARLVLRDAGDGQEANAVARARLILVQLWRRRSTRLAHRSKWAA
jgi:hypothetical protein